MSSSLPFKFVFVFVSLLVIEVIPIQLQEGEELKQNNVENSELNDCVSVQRSSEVGVCFGKELLNNLNKYDEAESFSLANGVSFVRDEKTPRHFGSFLDKDPMDFRSMMEDASNLISKRSLHWDLSGLYPGLVMKIGPTLANGMLEFVMDPRIKDRSYHQQHHGEMTTGRLLARNLLVPFLLGFKFQLSTLLPLVLGLVLIASKKAFLLAKVALLAVTVFSGGSGFGSQGSYGDYGSTPLSSYTAYDSPGYVHSHHGSGGSGDILIIRNTIIEKNQQSRPRHHLSRLMNSKIGWNDYSLPKKTMIQKEKYQKLETQGTSPGLLLM
ncbi:osiris 10a isoform X2 [Choristoneura fumiferana]|uniref:osiris 10a isoform X2 n=1 Tax=Choristoneura fumiferana TaxID=7141 RepID=UPI003D157493